MEKAARMAPKIAYMAACLLTETPFERISDSREFVHEKLIQDEFIKLNYSKKVDPLCISCQSGYIV